MKQITDVQQLKITAGDFVFIPTEVSEKNIICVGNGDLSAYKSQMVGFNCSAPGQSSISMPATVMACQQNNSAFAVDLLLESHVAHAVKELLKKVNESTELESESAQPIKESAPKVSRAMLASKPLDIAPIPKTKVNELLNGINLDCKEGDYYKIPIDLYSPGEKTDTDVYFYYQRQYVLFKSKQARWEVTDVQKLKNTDVNILFIRLASAKDHGDYLHAKLKGILNRTEVSVKRKAKVLYEISDPILTRIYTTPTSQETLTNAGHFAKSCIQYLNDRGSIPEMIKLSSENLTEHAHGLHCSTYAVALAKLMGYKDQNDLFALAMGGLLHDIGKAGIGPEVLQKETELSEDEWLLIREHPQKGFDIVKDLKIIPDLAKKIILEHHERVNGKGYPYGKKELHPFTKIISIVDAFNSIISPRPYREAKTPFATLQYMATAMNEEFDTKILAQFIQLLSV